MSWEYRVIRRDGRFGVHEVYYDSDGQLNGWTEDALSPEYESVEALMSDLARMAAAGRKVVLEEVVKGGREALEEEAP